VGYVFDAKMTPMIDVIFQLLIFFLCTAGFAVPESVLPTELPKETALSTLPAKPQQDVGVVRIQLSGRENFQIHLNNQPIATFPDLMERLVQIAGISKDVPVVLDVTSEVPIGQVIKIYDGALSSGLRHVHFAARIPGDGLKSK
jgi:biopolymer transport protein ExbD